jgi:hypothetical protein
MMSAPRISLRDAVRDHDVHLLPMILRRRCRPSGRLTLSRKVDISLALGGRIKVGACFAMEREMPDIRHELTIGTPARNVRAAITSQQGLSSWWTPDVNTNGVPDSIAIFGFGGSSD